MGPGPEVHAVEPLGVHGHERPGPEPGAGDQRGDEEVDPTVGQHHAQVDREVDADQLPPAPAERAAQVSAQQAQRWVGASLAAGLFESGAGLGVGPDRHQAVGHRTRRAVLAALGDRHARPVPAVRPRPTTPPRPPGAGGRRPARRRSTSSATSAAVTRESWRSRSISCFMLRTKSPPVTDSSPMTSARSSPAAHPWATAKKPGSGFRVCGRPASRSVAFRSEAIRSSCGPPPLHLARREPQVRLLGATRGPPAPRAGPRRASKVNAEAREATAAGSRSSNSPAFSASATSRSHSW